MKYTKGLWKVNTDNDGNINTVYSEYHGAICSFPKFYGVKETKEGIKELESNARLIATAPELLEAAILAIMDFENEGIELNKDTVTALRQAITKATQL